MTLKDAKPGMVVRINGLGNSSLKTRLMSMGMIPGTVVHVLRSAPFGDPMAVSVRSYVLSLRLSDAEKIEVEMAK